MREGVNSMGTVYWCKPIFCLKPHFCDYITKDIKTHLFNLVHMIALNLQSEQFFFLIMVRKTFDESPTAFLFFLRTPYFEIAYFK